MKRSIIIGLLALSGQSFAQNQHEIFKYSFISPTASARTLGAGGAWGAAGADMAGAAINPAGFGLYRRNEVMGSMAITSKLNNTTYNGNTMSDGRTNFNIPNFGYVATINNGYMGKDQTHSGVTSGSFAFGMNRLADFQNNIQYSGLGKNTTIGDYFAAQANGIDSTAFKAEELDNDPIAQAWRLRMIDNDGGSKNYASNQSLWGDTNYTMQQFNQIEERGRINEWYAGGGLNFGNTLYLGASLVIQGLRYKNTTTYRETLKDKSVAGNPYQQASVTQYSETRGSGVGGKFGIILRPIDLIRVGLSYHTPVRLNLQKDYEFTTTVNYDGINYTQDANRLDRYEYQIVTPGRLTASTAVVLGKFMVITADFERVDYRSGRLNDKVGNANFTPANDAMKTTYGIANNLRTGLEIATGYTRWRLGYGLLGSPYQESVVSKEDGLRQLVSGGFGWLYGETYFFDLAVQGIIGKTYLSPYAGIPSSAVNESLNLNFVFGAGYRF